MVNEDYLSTLSTLCLDDFLALYNRDSYISKREIDHFLDRYSQVFLQDMDCFDAGKSQKLKLIANHFEDMISSHNEQFLELKMKEYQNYFDTMFASIDPSIVLDEEQRRAILIDEDYSLIVAGAGSGKTTTMAAKAKYLVEKCHVKPRDIILLSFTNKAVEELDERINQNFGLGIEVLTFHKLGRKLLGFLSDEPLKTVVDSGQYQIVLIYLKHEIFKDKEKLKRIIDAFPSELHFDPLCYQYDTYEEYFRAYKQKRYEMVHDELPSFIKKIKDARIKNKRTLNGELLKSKAEVTIANFLYENGISYEYEKVYPHKTEEKTFYEPDFTCTSMERPVYIEYFGITKNQNNDAFSQDEVIEYNRYLKKKQELHQKYGTDLIELYSYYETGDDPISVLERELRNRGIIFMPRSNDEIFNRIMDTTEDWQFLSFARLICFFIAKWKEKLLTDDDFERIEKKVEDEKTKEQLLIAKDIYHYYQNTLKTTSSIDFSDMINYASRDLDAVKEKCNYLNYKYIIVDEYQDISISRYQLMKRLSDIFESKIVAVGDDWQSIYEFSGSDMELFTSFRNSMGYGEIITITNTYRNSQELIDTAGEFISQNSLQFQKSLKSNKHLQKPIEIIYYYEESYSHKMEVLESVLEKLYRENPTQKILLLGRYKNDIEDFLSDAIYQGLGDKIIFTKARDMDITFLTVHKSKGLGFDQVILLNALSTSYGFPSKIKDKPLIALLKEDNKEESIIEYPEERRLFYVSLTRTKNKIYILAPYNVKMVSEFVCEIKNDLNVLENKDYVEEEVI